MAFPQTPLTVKVELLLGGAWVDITADVYLRDPISIRWGRADEAARVDYSKCPLVINNRSGKYSPRNPTSPYYGLLGRNTPVRISVTTPSGTTFRRFTGEISSWPARWDVSGHDVWVPVEAAGIIRRLGQGTKPLRDSLRRFIEFHKPLAYWPLTDGEDARQGSEVASGGQPMRPIGTAGSFYQGQPDWGKGALAPWLDATVDLPDETSGSITASVTYQSLSSWTVDHFRSGTETTADLTVETTGSRTDTDPLVSWSIQTEAFDKELHLFAASRGETTSSSGFPVFLSGVTGMYDLDAHHIRLTCTDDGAGGTNWELLLDGVSMGSGNQPRPFRPIARVKYSWNLVTGGGFDVGPLTVGHIVYWGGTAPGADQTYQALQGYVRELAGRRLERLCAEQGVSLQVTGDLDDSPPMGPQKSGRYLDLLQTAVDVDGGVLYEARDELALAYRTRASKYNQGV
ncbi:hypothetical protein [Streptomyces sp. NPDC005970]|uniref:hypothetical protein n=1 Tax=Streptomyces sp. NPDC005970 TaxID=3156723 RepID=UPI003404F757